MFKAKKQTNNKAMSKPTAKKEILKDLPVGEELDFNNELDVKGGAVDAFVYFDPPPRKTKSQRALKTGQGWADQNQPL
jgi:hypothetical protein